MTHSSVLKLKRYAKCLVGRDFLTHYDCTLSATTMGSDYGGWTVHTDPLKADSVIYSFGIGEDASFDQELISRFGATVHGFDPTPKSINWVAKQGFSEKFVMHPYGLADNDGVITFYPPETDSDDFTIIERPDEAKKEALHFDVKRLKTVMKELGHNRIDLLKMDIEGSEYGVIEDMCASDLRPSQILLEYHHMHPSISIDDTKASVKLLRDAGYSLYHISDTGYEYSFIYIDG